VPEWFHLDVAERLTTVKNGNQEIQDTQPAHPDLNILSFLTAPTCKPHFERPILNNPTYFDGCCAFSGCFVKAEESGWYAKKV
jgi:hypothetical protein